MLALCSDLDGTLGISQKSQGSPKQTFDLTSLLVGDREDVLHVLPAALVAVAGHAEVDADGGRHADPSLSLNFPENPKGQREIPGNGSSTLCVGLDRAGATKSNDFFLSSLSLSLSFISRQGRTVRSAISA